MRFIIMIIKCKMGPKEMYSCLKDTVSSASAIMALVAFANVFAFILTKEHIPSMIADAMLHLTTNKYLILLLIKLSESGNKKKNARRTTGQSGQRTSQRVTAASPQAEKARSAVEQVTRTPDYTDKGTKTMKIIEDNGSAIQDTLRQNGVQLENWQTVSESRQEPQAQDYQGSSKNPYRENENHRQDDDRDGESFAEIIASM